MLNLKKEAKSMPVEELRLSKCPPCQSYVSHVYFMQDVDTKKQSKWYSCACGVVFQDKKPDGIYDKQYSDKYDKYESKLKDSFEYPVRIYSPIIEELIYNRRVLLVGHVTSHQHDEFKRRGWVAHSIDKNSSYEGSRELFVGDFETHEFNPNIKYGLIWLYQTLECMDDPINALYKAKSLLTEDGIVVIASPDTDFIHTRGSGSFIHWKPEHNHIMWNRSSLTRQLENLGFNVILSRQNYEHRFPAWDDFHIIAQLKFF